MELNHTIKTNEGNITIQGEVSEQELNAIIEAGLFTLYKMGLIKPNLTEAENNELKQAQEINNVG